MSDDAAAAAMPPETPTDRAGAEPADRPWRRWLFDPLLTYILLAGIVGSVLCVMLPLFAGNDEATHFVRAYQMSTGHLVPVDAPAHARVGSGACVPDWLALDYQAQQLVQLVQLNRPKSTSSVALPRTGHAPTAKELQQFARHFTESLPRCDGANHFFIDTSTFAWYSPLTYLPSAAAIAVGRAAGWRSVGLERGARFAQLAIVILLVAFAIRRTPWGRWAFAIVALTPLALVVSSTIRPDAITTALSLVVIASALRVVARGAFTRGSFVDALVWSALLGLSKPTYWVVAGAFLAVLLRLRWRERGVLGTLRDGGWMAFVPVAVSAAASTVWQSAQRNRFICDVRFFGLQVDTHQAVHEILTRPNRFLGGAIRVVRDNTGSWLRELVQIDARITGPSWPVVTVAVVLLAYLALALRPQAVDGAGTPTPRTSERVLYGVLAVVFFLALAAGFAVYCSAPGTVNALFFTARFLLPVILLALLAVASAGRIGRLLLRQPVPPLVALAAFYAVYLVAVSHTVS